MIFSKTVEFNDAVGTMSTTSNPALSSTEYTSVTGVMNFSEAHMEDTVVFQNFANAENNGTFIINGISDDGKTISVNNSNGINTGATAVNPGDIAITSEITEGDSVILGDSFTDLNRGKFRVIGRGTCSTFFLPINLSCRNCI